MGHVRREERARAMAGALIAQTRRFYEAAGVVPLEILPTVWGDGLPVLVYLRWIGGGK
jgi:hypothetical protein